MPAERTGSFRIAGTVVDALDGHPLGHARITLYEISGNDYNGTAGADADDEGIFSVPGLPAGRYRLEGAARAYITGPYDGHEGFSSAIVTGAGLPTESLVLRLTPAASIGGRVTDEAGDPIRSSFITLYRESADDGTRRITRIRSERSDDLGEYETAQLEPGTYYVAVQATPWYATFPQPAEAEGGGLGVAANVDPELNAVYPLTFYPAATESDGALPVTLKAGERFHADFHLTAQPATRLTLHVPGNGSGGPNGSDGRNGPDGRNIPQLQQKVFGDYQGLMQQRVQVLGGNVEISGLSAGHYVLRQLGTGNYDGPVRDVEVGGGGLSVDVSNAAPFGTVTLTLAAAGGSHAKPPSNLGISLRRKDLSEAGPAVFGKDGKVEFANLAPGDYRVEPQPEHFHAESITANGHTTSGAMLHVSGAGQAATVTVGTGSVNMTGFVHASGKDGKPVSGAMVVLVPAGGDHSLLLYRRDQSDLDGGFTLADVLPGNYLLVAISDGWSLEWGKPEALAPYLVKAAPVAVPPGREGAMKIAEAVLVQSR